MRREFDRYRLSCLLPLPAFLGVILEFSLVVTVASVIYTLFKQFRPGRFCPGWWSYR